MHHFHVLFLTGLACLVASSGLDHASNSPQNKFGGHGPAFLKDTGNANYPTALPQDSLASAQETVSLFQKAMAKANRALLGSPSPNVYRHLNRTELQQARGTAKPLAYGPSLRNDKEDDENLSNRASYTIPPEVINAARIMAEANPPQPGNYRVLLRTLKKRRGVSHVNDTNIMAQRIQRPSGLVEYVPPDELAVTYQNDTQVAGPPESEPQPNLFANPDDEESEENEIYWQETLPQLGRAPFASDPATYQVWRNVRDYGAMGDGLADDTAAINLAISSGGRCGGDSGECPSSTRFPATVYFPSGTYLVSSPIIQYYNTEFLGNPLSPPVILAAPSFVGFGVIASNVYTGENTTWYLNTNNFLRSLRNFVIDIRATPPEANVCAVHWQVAQGSSLDNIVFVMSEEQETTQVGIYMENGSGGFMGNLMFYGGKLGAYLGNQQFTATGLLFSHCHVGVQIHWDWSWTMQDLLIQDCNTGIVIAAGAGTDDPLSTGQGVGSLTLVDLTMSNMPLGISASFPVTSLYLQNARFQNVTTIVQDSATEEILFRGTATTNQNRSQTKDDDEDDEIDIPAWGYGTLISAGQKNEFIPGAPLPFPSLLPSSLVVSDPSKPFGTKLYHRKRPEYPTLGSSQIFNVREYGAAGDGVSDDTAVLNKIFDIAANLSAIIYIPHGVYVITNTVLIPLGSRVVGQAWPQIMAVGEGFGDANRPKVAVRVGERGDVGVVEIQGIMFTVRGGTAGAVLVEWNVHEGGQGWAGLWDSHFRVGGAAGSDLQTPNCPKNNLNPHCVAASLLLHITEKASAYLENVWLWTADHDLDSPDQDLINVYAARGMLIESQGPTWLWGTTVEHCVLYQYQLSAAKDVVMGLVQTESPYFQPAPRPPQPFDQSLTFKNDPTFADCPSLTLTCAMSWALRVIESSNIFVLSTGIYTWFWWYDRTCIDNGRHDCQLRNIYTEQSYNVWIYNLVTIGTTEMLAPLNGEPILARDNRNGFASSIMAWLGGANQTTGERTFPGYQLYTAEDLASTDFSQACKTALITTITCENSTSQWTVPSYHGSLENATFQAWVCDRVCGQSLAGWYQGVESNCAAENTWTLGAPLSMLGGYIWYGFNETCQTDESTGQFCTDVISSFSLSTTLDEMPISELCSPCYLERLRMMQSSSYSIFGVMPWYQRALETAITKCSLFDIPTSPPPPLIPPAPPTDMSSSCLWGDPITVEADTTTCDDLALRLGVSSASIFYSIPHLTDCTTTLPEIPRLCPPLPCKTYQLLPSDDCISASFHSGIEDISLFNPWIDSQCDNLHEATSTLGRILCVSPPGGIYVPGSFPPSNTSASPAAGGGGPAGAGSSPFGKEVIPPPEGVEPAEGTTLQGCAGWYVLREGDQCATITVENALSLDMFTLLNPSVDPEGCTASLVVGRAYCVLPALPDAPSVRGEEASGREA